MVKQNREIPGQKRATFNINMLIYKHTTYPVVKRSSESALTFAIIL